MEPQHVWLYGVVEACKNNIEAATDDLVRVSELLGAVCERLKAEQGSKPVDEIELQKALKNAHALINEAEDAQAKNAMLVLLHLIHGLNERIDELMQDEDDE